MAVRRLLTAKTVSVPTGEGKLVQLTLAFMVSLPYPAAPV
jgi:hypothetical protein